MNPDECFPTFSPTIFSPNSLLHRSNSSFYSDIVCSTDKLVVTSKILFSSFSLDTRQKKKRKLLSSQQRQPIARADCRFSSFFFLFPIEQRGKTFSTIGAPKRTGKRVGLIDCASASPHSLENKRLGELVGNAVPPDGSSHLPSRSVPYLAARVWDNKSSASRSPSVVASRPKRHEFLDVRCKLN